MCFKPLWFNGNNYNDSPASIKRSTSVILKLKTAPLNLRMENSVVEFFVTTFCFSYLFIFAVQQQTTHHILIEPD